MKDNIKVNINVLRYQHSQVLGELVNIGLLVYYLDQKKIKLLTISDFNRLSSLYENFQGSIVKQQVNYINDQISKISLLELQSEDNKVNILSFINKNILPKDSSQLQFGEDNMFYYPYKQFDQTKFEDKLVKTYLLASKQFISENDHHVKISNLDSSLSPWIAPDYKNKIAKINKDFIYLPGKAEL